ncbi:MAG: hypothetical protein ACRCYU_21410 [Nocardioides sp.]
MDAVTVIETAVAAGALAGAKASASMAVRDAYAGLKNLILGRVREVPGGAVTLEQYPEDTATWQAPLRKALESSGASADEAIVAAAHSLLALTDPEGSAAGRYVVTASGERSVAVGGNVGGDIVTGEIQR